jgi:hypothetical protein
VQFVAFLALAASSAVKKVVSWGQADAKGRVVSTFAPEPKRKSVTQQSCHFCIAPSFSCAHAVPGLDGLATGGKKMKRSIALSASLIIAFLAGSTGTGSAVVYCQYAGYPANCVVRPGVVVAPGFEPRRIPPSIDARPSGLIRQDLFDRNNPNNLRSDWPSPPAQPGQF